MIGQPAALQRPAPAVPRGCSMTPAPKPVVFRTLDIGGDKALPYMRQPQEETRRWAGARSGSASTGPACCAPRSARCCAPARRDLRIMFPMVPAGRRSRRRQGDRRARADLSARPRKATLPERIDVGTMLEVPALLYRLDEILERVVHLGPAAQRPVPVHPSRSIAATPGSPTALTGCRHRSCAGLSTSCSAPARQAPGVAVQAVAHEQTIGALAR